MIALLPVLEVLLIVSVPVAAPAAVGSNETVRASVDCGASVTGNEPPEVMENALPEIAAELIVTAAVPEEVSVSDSDLVDASATLPKASVVALIVSCEEVAAAPVPVRVTVEVAPVVALLLMVILPVAAPAVVGANVTGRDRDCPAERVIGRLVAPSENPVPVIAAELTVTEPVPEEVSVTDSDLLVASVTLPKARVVALNVS
jgi:hypothetical protein